MIKIIDLFCGIGGLSYGLKMAGLNVVAGIDSDARCKYAYEKNNKAVFIEKSVSKLTGEELMEMFGNADVRVLVGCAPCQPFSNHQKKKNSRNTHKDWGLLNEFLRLVEESNPHIVSMENVPTLKKEQVFFDFVEGLINLGYSVNYKIHNTANYGMAQRRNRLLLLASKYGEIDFAKDEEAPKTVADVIEGLPKISAGEVDSKDLLHRSAKLSDLNLKRIRSSVPGGTWKDWPKELLLECYKKKSGQSYKTVYGRMEFGKIAPTLTTQFYSYGTGRFGHPVQDRAISIREGAMIQSFPRGYKFVADEDKIQLTVLARQIGNAVPPRLGKHIGVSIQQHLLGFET